MNAKTDTQTEDADFGWALPKRRELLKEAASGGPHVPTYPVPDFEGEQINLPVIRVKIGFPKYRILNGRTVSAQQEYIAKHSNLKENFFRDKDPELDIVQKAQHEILMTMLNEAGLRKKFKDPTQKQTEPILLDSDGFVVNGNRRLCCWRALVAEDDQKYTHFRSINVISLPPCDELEINRIEAMLQIAPNIRGDYSWHAEANMYISKMRQLNKKIPYIAKLYGKKPSEIEKLIAKRDLAVEYLKSRKMENMWSVVQDSNYAFESLHRSYRKLSSPSEKEIFKNLAFTVIDQDASDGAGERIYAIIPKIQEYLSPVVNELRNEFLTDSSIEQEDDITTPFSGDVESTSIDDPAKDLNLISSLRKSSETLDRARDIIFETVRTQQNLKDEKNKKNLLVSLLKKALTNVSNAELDGLKPEYSIRGAEEQIRQIRQSLDNIEAWVKSRGS